MCRLLAKISIGMHVKCIDDRKSMGNTRHLYRKLIRMSSLYIYQSFI